MKFLLLGLCALIFLAGPALSSWLRRRADPRLVRSLDEIPQEALIVVLGCTPRSPSGRFNAYFIGRVASAAAAYHAGPDRQILCSGRTVGRMSEADELATALKAAAVPSAAIDLDRDSARTIDSIDHVAKHYANRPIVFVTQAFHQPRTLFLSRHRNLEAWGLLARGAKPRLRGRLRERLAELRAVRDVLFGRR
jgi:SanA protein